jgi:hypothetical protein
MIASEAIDFPGDDGDSDEAAGDEEERAAKTLQIVSLSDNEDFKTVAAALPVTKVRPVYEKELRSDTAPQTEQVPRASAWRGAGCAEEGEEGRRFGMEWDLSGSELSRRELSQRLPRAPTSMSE